jgi:O-antigen/teichoic acid export membrane protein
MLKRILKVLFALSIGQLILRLSSIILIPLFVNFWSTTTYGEWLALTAAIGYLASLDFGITQASTNKMTQAYALQDLATYKKVQNSSLYFFLIIAVVFSFICAFIIWLLPINKILGISTITNFETKTTLLLLSFYILWSLPSRIITSSYVSIGRIDKSQWIDNFQKFSYLLVVTILLLLNQSVIAVAGTQLVLMILTAFYTMYDLNKNYQQVYPGIKLAERKEIKALILPGFFFTIYLVANLFWTQGSVILISSLFGGLLVAVFSISRTLSMFGRQAVDSIYFSLFPDLASLFAKKENDRLKQIHKLLILISFSIAVLFSVVFWFYGKDIIFIWTVGKVVADEKLLRLLLIYITFQTPYIASASILLSTNNHKKFTLYYLAANLFGIIFSYFLIKQFGIYIIPICFMVAEIIICYHFVLRETCKLIGEKLFRLYYSLIMYFLPMLIMIYASGYLINYFVFNSDMSIKLIAGIGGTLIVSTLIIWVIFPKTEKKFLMNKIKELKA